jgi:hypothetical protein
MIMAHLKKKKKKLHQGPHSCAKAKATTIRLDNGAKKLGEEVGFIAP